ncbi:glycosyltransferase family 2 protein [Marinomonas sp. NPDC078689]|uniref:glycosyltransferase family 2 protein n=1 Tax=Marinomonas sp. NPDC078689 TaxID=3364147 RepID=UPI0037C81BAB
MKIKLSVIIPYYNSKESLSRLLDSIPIFEAIEILVINDHSDDISDVIAKHGSAFLYEQVEGKKWAGAARNLGLKHARGEYILFADADDYFLDGFFSLVSEYFESGKDVIYFSPTSIKVNGESSKRHLRYEELVKNYVSAQDLAIKYRFHVPWSKLFRRRFLLENSIQFDEVIASNDVVFSLKSSVLAESVAADQRSIYCVVESDSSLTKIKSEEVLDSRFYASCRYNDFLRSIGDKNEAAMSQFIYHAYKFSFYKSLSVFFFCKYKKYKVFYDFSHIMKVAKREFKYKLNSILGR